MRVEALGDQIARTDVQEKTGENGQDKPEGGGRGGEPLGRGDAGSRRGGIDEQPAEGAPALAAIFHDDVHRVDAVRKIVCQHRGCDDHADAVRGLKRDADCGSVQETVQRQDAGTKRPALPGPVMRRCGPVDQHHPVDREVEQKAGRRPRQRRRLRTGLRRERERLRQQIEEHDAEHSTGAEAEHEMQSVLEFPGEYPACQGAQKGRAGDGGE
jgi:hypothetical protein